MKKILTLCVVCEDGKVLLGMKKRGFGAGRWNGFGGKLEAGETIEDGIKREAVEEAGITLTKMEKVGILDFSFQDESSDLKVHVFKVDDFSGEPVETEEMFPEWFPYEEIPYGQMWPDDEYWLPFLLTHKLFKGRFVFDAPASESHEAQIIEYEMDVVEELVSNS